MSKIDQILKAKYGTADVQSIVHLKTTEPQTHSVSSSKAVTINATKEECRTLFDSAGIVFQDGFEKRLIEYTLSDESVDRDGDIIVASGALLDNYKTNPVVILWHDGRQFPVGNIVKIWNEDRKLKGWVFFADDSIDTSGISERCFRFAKSRIMRAGSIGFSGRKVEFPDRDMRMALGMKEWGVIFREWELFEFSLCCVPANANALSDALRKGILKPEDKDFIELDNEEINMTKEQLQALIGEEIKTALAGKNKDAPPVVEKVGRGVSAANLSKMQAIHDHCSAGVKLIKEFIDEHTPSETDPEETDADEKANKEAEEKSLQEISGLLSEVAEAFTK